LIHFYKRESTAQFYGAVIPLLRQREEKYSLFI